MKKSRFLYPVVIAVIAVGLLTVATASAITPAGTWSDGATGGGLSDIHGLGGAALLGDGTVIVAGGLNSSYSGTADAEIYNPGTQSWSSTASMSSNRWSIDAIALNNGKALFAGGSTGYFSGSVLATAEVYDPGTSSFIATNNNLSVARHGYGISALNDGRILITGGSTVYNSLNGEGVITVDIYDPVDNSFSTAASLKASRSLHAQTTLNNGKVVVFGGAWNNAEVYDPNADTWTLSTNTMSTIRLKDMKAFELYNGKVFIAAGQNIANGVTTDNTWFFDPDTGLFSAGPSMAGFNYRGGTVYQGTSDYSAFDLFEGTANEGRYILFAGGEHEPLSGSDVTLDSASIYDAAQNMFFDVGPTTFPHDDHTESILLNDGSGNPRVLLFGGNSTYGTSLFTFDATSVPPPPAPPAVHYTFKETSPGTWEVLIEVTGDETSGLSAYEIWVDVDPSTVSYEENVLGTVVDDPVGFSPDTLLADDVGGSFNAGNFQGSGDAAIQGVGMIEIDEPGSDPGITPHVDLDVPALLGTLSTEAGLGEDDFRAITAGLLNAAGDGFYDASGLIPTYEVIPFVLLLGDANNDGVVSAADYASVHANFGNTGAAGIFGDANGDGVVSAADYASVQANFGNTAATQVTPEPATLSLLVIGGLAMIRRRKHRV